MAVGGVGAEEDAEAVDAVVIQVGGIGGGLNFEARNGEKLREAVGREGLEREKALGGAARRSEMVASRLASWSLSWAI